MALLTLWDSPQLAPLARAARRAGVELELFGSVATRALLFDAAKAKVPSLFDLAEHVADIDLAHSGSAESTHILEWEIARELPLAPWFRWSILDRKQAEQRDALREFNIRVPLRELSLDTRPDPAGARAERGELLSRALEGTVEIIGGDRFGRSPRADFDTEASAVLLFLDATLDVFDAQLRVGDQPEAKVGSEPAIILNQGLDRLERLAPAGRGAAMRRLWYRLAGALMRAPPELYLEIIRAFGLERLFSTLKKEGFPVDAFRGPFGAPTFVSAFLGKKGFRIPLDASPNANYQPGSGFPGRIARVWTGNEVRAARIGPRQSDRGGAYWHPANVRRQPVVSQLRRHASGFRACRASFTGCPRAPRPRAA